VLSQAFPMTIEVTPREHEVRRKLISEIAPASQGWVHRLIFRTMDRFIDSVIRRFETLEARCAVLEARTKESDRDGR
jgi:hypothetical protein